MRSERITAYAAGSFLIGILLARTKNPLWLLPAAALAAFLCAAAHFAGNPKKKLLYLFLIGAQILLGSLRYSSQNAFRERYLPYLKDGTEVRVQGLIYQKEFKNQNSIYYLKKSLIQTDQIKAPCNQIQVYLDSDSYPLGATVVIDGTVKAFSLPRNEGNFDQRLFMESRKIDLCVFGEKAREVGERRLPLERTLWEIRERLRLVYEKAATELDAGILSAMLLGDKTALNKDVRALYQVSGISHILAISGLHISLIGSSLLWLLRVMRLPKVLSSLLAAIFMGCYVVMTGGTPSAMRAYVMFLLALLALLCKRTYDSVTALSVSLLLLLWENPFLTGYSGFVFSFTAVLSVIAYGKVLSGEPAFKGDRGRKVKETLNEEKGQGVKEKVNGFLKEKGESLKRGIPAAIALQLVTLPVVMWNYYEVPLYALLLNLLILPFLGLVLSFGAVGGVAGLLGLLPISRAMLLVPHYILYIYGHICRIMGELPGADLITGKPSPWMVAVYYAVLTAAFMAADLLKKRPVTLIPAFLLLLLLLLPKRPGYEFSMLDVGQGDGLYIASNGGVAFVDGGSTSVKQVGKYRIEPFLKAKGIRSVDFWLVTHTDADHINGLEEILDGNIKINTLVFSRFVFRDSALEELLKKAREKGTRIAYLKPGERIHLGDAELTCLFPDDNYMCDDKNGLSLVTMLSMKGVSFLLTGDISAKEEQYLLKEEGLRSMLSDTDFFKACHHGSRYSNSEEFLRLLSPDFAGISCGEGNRYGHPSPDTISRLDAAGISHLCTIDCGEIRILPEADGRYRVITQLSTPDIESR